MTRTSASPTSSEGRYLMAGQTYASSALLRFSYVRIQSADGGRNESLAEELRREHKNNFLKKTKKKLSALAEEIINVLEK